LSRGYGLDSINDTRDEIVVRALWLQIERVKASRFLTL
jgi:hypothetical protein